MIPQSFLNGMRAATSAGGMGDVRPHAMRSMDQNQTQSGNPGLSYNMPQMVSDRMGGGAPMGIVGRMPQYQAPMMGNQLAALQQMQQGQQVPGGLSQIGDGGQVMGGMPNYAKPMLRFNPPGNAQPPVGTMPVQQGPVAGYRRPMVTNLNRGRFGTNRILQQ